MAPRVRIGGQTWRVRWLPGETPPAGRNHGSSGVCVSGEGVVLISRDGVRWEFPAGRPEGQESLLGTLRREVDEEACCRVECADLLGFTESTCVEGPEQGLVLVRSHWAARVTEDAWSPRHETVGRMVVPLSVAAQRLHVEAGLEGVYTSIWDNAAGVLGVSR